MSNSIIQSPHFVEFCKAPAWEWEWEDCCTDKFQGQVKVLVTNYITSSRMSTEVTTQFLTALTFVNSKYQQIKGIEPFTGEIQKIKGLLPNSNTPPIPARSVKTLTAQFTLSETPVENKIAPARNNKMATPSPQTKITSIKERIVRLDLNSPNLKTEIKEIITDLHQLSNKQHISKKNCEDLIHALEKIQDGYSFNKADAFFTSLASFLERNHPEDSSKKIDLSEYRSYKKAESTKARSDLLKLLKMNVDGFFTEKSTENLSTFHKNTIKNFYTSLLLHYKKQLALFDPKLISNFSVTCKMFSNFHKLVSEHLTNEFQTVKITLDNQSNQLFSKLLPNYSYLNCINKESLLSFSSIYSDLFLANHLLGNKENQIENLDVEINNHFSSFYTEHFLNRHIWIATNGAHIVKPYNQGDDPCNIIQGVCLNNCLDRYALFLAEPTMAASDIPLKISSAGLFAQTRSEAAFRSWSADQPEKVRNKINSEIEGSPNRLGLEPSSEPISIQPEVNKPIVDVLLNRISKEIRGINEPMQFILSLRDSSGTGHAINVQFDKKRKVYRFIDDNLGICEYQDGISFSKALKSYLTFFYAKMIKFELQFYKKKG